MMVLENSPDEFTVRFHEYATQGILYPHIEGGPLLEFASKGRVLYLFDRSGPYGIPSGEASVIVHPLLKTWELTPEREERLFPTGVSSVEGTGKVLEVQRGFLIVQARITLVIGILENTMPKVLAGEWIKFSSESPIHGFVVTEGAGKL